MVTVCLHGRRPRTIRLPVRSGVLDGGGRRARVVPMTDHDAANDPTIDAVLDLWFGPLDASGRADEQHRARWFRKDPEFDRRLTERFAAAHAQAAVGACDAWQESARGALALVILLDQFSRNMFRGEAAAFAQDPRALAVAMRAIERGFDRAVAADQRSFFYLPFMHSEGRVDQERCVALFSAWALEPGAAGDKAVASNLDYARRHRDIVQRFGRFPHRNATLGRSSTPEEEEFLKGPGSSF